MGRLTGAANAAQWAFLNGPRRLNGVIGVYGPTGAFLGGDNAGRWVEQQYSPQNNHHVEALLLGSMLTAFGNDIPDGSRVYLYCHYSPCQQCFDDLKEYPKLLPRVRWKLGFNVYYAPPGVASGEGLWPDVPSACRAIYRLILHKWAVRQFSFVHNQFTKPATPLRFMRMFQNTRADLTHAIVTEPQATRTRLYDNILKAFVDHTVGD